MILKTDRSNLHIAAKVTQEDLAKLLVGQTVQTDDPSGWAVSLTLEPDPSFIPNARSIMFRGGAMKM